MPVFIKKDGVMVPLFTKKNGEIIPKVTRLLCDKLFITIPIDLDKQSEVIKRIKECGSHKQYSGRYGCSYKFNMPKNYNLNTDIYDDWTGESHVLIQCDPKNKLWNYLRIEMNPSKIYMLEFQGLIDSIVPDVSYVELMNRAIVNRIDLTVDVLNVPVDRLYFYRKGISYSNVITKSGRTIKLGDDNSERQFCIYDKIAEIKHKNSKKTKKIKEVIPPFDVVRIEYRARLKKARFETLYAELNPFSKLSVWKFPAEAWSKSSLNKLILKLAKYEGLQSPLLLVKKTEKKQFEECSKSFLCEFWKPDEIWAGLPDVIGEILDPSAYHKPL